MTKEMMDTTETIKLLGSRELGKGENLPEVPVAIRRYLDIKDGEHQAEGEFFRIRIKRNREDFIHAGGGSAYFNELVLEKRAGDSWEQAYSTGMMKYRGAYARDIDNWDLSLHDPSIFEESESEVTYALRTGDGNVKVYRFSAEERHPEILESFNVRDFERTRERIELLGNVDKDVEAFRSYVSKNCGHHWMTTDSTAFDAPGNKLEGDKEIAEKAEVCVLLEEHADRDYDAIMDQYRLHIWVKGRGVYASEAFRTGLRHPGGKFYCVGLGMRAALAYRGPGLLGLTVEVGNKSQRVHRWHRFRVEWDDAKASAFDREIGEAMASVVVSHQWDHPLYKPARIAESAIDARAKRAAWILFEQIDTDRGSEDAEGWLGDQFRYSLWTMKAGQEPVRLYEDHAYIRPRAKSELTGTQGRDCTLKELRLKGTTVTVRHAAAERVEDPEAWEDLTFKV